MSTPLDWADMNGSASVDAVKATMVKSPASPDGAASPSSEKKDGSAAASPTAKPGEDESTCLLTACVSRLTLADPQYSSRVSVCICVVAVDPEVELAAQQLKESRIDKETALGPCREPGCP